MKPSECIGCLRYSRDEIWCFAIAYTYMSHMQVKNIESCACATCLVKVMCNEKLCDDFKKSRKLK